MLIKRKKITEYSIIIFDREIDKIIDDGATVAATHHSIRKAIKDAFTLGMIAGAERATEKEFTLGEKNT